MKIDDAIEMLGSILKDRKHLDGCQGNDAIKLGREALRRIKAIRPYSNSDQSYYLPGETKD